MQQLALHHLHKESGASFASYGAWELPEHYGDPLQEYRVIRERAGLADLSHEGKFLITGADRISFLQSLTSNDLTHLQEGSGIYATLLTPKGKIISDFDLFPLPEALLMAVDSSNAEKTRTHLMRYRLRAKVEMSAPSWGKILVSGPAAKFLIAQLIGEDLHHMSEKSIIEKKFNGLQLLCVKRSITGEEDFLLYFPQQGMALLWKRLNALNIQPVGQAALETLRVEAGKPRYGIDIDERILPVEAGIQDEAISYTKGCYPGQEVIARIKTYGHVNKQLFGLILEGEALPKKGDKIYDEEKEVGWVTSAVASPLLGKGVAMGYLRTQAAIPGNRLRLEMDQGRTNAEATPLPFFKKEKAL